MRATFTPEEMQTILGLAEKRNGTKSKKQNMRYCDSKDLDLHIVGLMGEWAVSRLIAAEIDRRTLKHGDDGVDLRANGVTIQVKTTLCDYEHGNLYFDHLGKFTSDIAVLALRCAENEVRIAGWIPRQEFEFLRRTANFGHGDRVAVHESWLRDPDTLLKYLYVEHKQ